MEAKRATWSDYKYHNHQFPIVPVPPKDLPHQLGYRPSYLDKALNGVTNRPVSRARTDSKGTRFDSI